MARKDLRSKFNTRQYMVNSDFEIYYYSDTNMQDVENHTHNYYELYFFLDGNVSVTVNSVTTHLSAGDIIVIPPKTRHYLTVHDATKAYRRFIFWISESYCDQLIDISKAYGYILQQAAVHHKYVYHLDFLSYNSIQSMIMNLIEEMHSQRFGRETRISLCIQDLMLSLNRNIYELEHPASEQETKSLYDNLLSYIETHITEDLTLNTLSEEFYVSKYHISHIFKENTGLSLHQYIQKKRLSLCKGAILGGGEITSVYLQFGFKEYSSFYRAFKKEYGLSPKDCKIL